MIPDALDFILRPTQDEQAEYAAAHKTPAPEPEGEASTGAGQTPASLAPSLQGEAGPDSSDADAVGAPASEVQTPAGAFELEPVNSAPRPQVSPRWSAVPESTGDLLDLIANEHPAIPEEERQWEHFVAVLQEVARATGLIDQNVTRPLLRGEVKPQRVGAFFHRATKSGLIRAEGWTVSNDLEGKNSGKPTRVYRWLGT